MSARMGRGIALAALLVVGLTGVAWAQSVTVTLDLTGSGSGTVTSSPAGFSCTGSAHTCTASFAVNTAVTLTATPASGQTFGGWSGACTGTAGCTIVTSTGQLVAATFNGAAAYVYYHEDAIGSVRAITSEAGATVATHDYQPFGEDIAPLTGDPIRFGGKELDPETGQNYFGARYYRNTLGRFTSVDPADVNALGLVNPQRMNRYAYAANSPLAYVDPDGRDAIVVNFSQGGPVSGHSFGHAGIIAVHPDGTVTLADFGPEGAVTWGVASGHVNVAELPRIVFGPDGLPMRASLLDLSIALASTEGYPVDSVRLAYFKTSAADTARLDAWMRHTHDKWQGQRYDFIGRNCANYCLTGLMIARGASVPEDTMVEGLAIPNFDFQLLALIAAETYQPEAKVRTDETYCYPAQDETCKK